MGGSLICNIILTTEGLSQFMYIMITGNYTTQYKAHDKSYAHKREQGRLGWDAEEEHLKKIALLTKLLQLPIVPKSGKILDIGCGAGEISFWLEQKGYQLTGIDVSEVAIDWAKNKAAACSSKAQFYELDATDKVEIPQAPFDLVIDINCLHCIIGLDRQQYLGNIRASLKAGGIYLLTTMCSEEVNRDIISNFDPESKLIIANQIALRYIGKAADILQELQQAGFTISIHELSCDADSTAENVKDLLVICIKPLVRS